MLYDEERFVGKGLGVSWQTGWSLGAGDAAAAIEAYLAS